MSNLRGSKGQSLRTLYGVWKKVWKRRVSRYPDPVPPGRQEGAKARRLRQ